MTDAGSRRTLRAALFGIGNVLVGDDAVGPAVIAYMVDRYDFPAAMEVEDIGTPSLDFASRLGAFDAVIIVDAVSATLPPGSIRTYTLEEILKHPPGLRISPHDPSLKETLLTAMFAGDAPPYVRMVGIVPESTDAFGMTAVVQRAIPFAVNAVIHELAQLGIEVTPKPRPDGHIPWWMISPGQNASAAQ